MKPNSAERNAVSEILRKNNVRKRWAIFLVSALVLLVAAQLFTSSSHPALESQRISTMHADLAAGKVVVLQVEPSLLSNTFTVELKDGTRYETNGPRLDLAEARALQSQGVQVSFQQPAADYTALPHYLLIAILIVAMLASLGQSVGITFTRSASRSTTKFADVAGNLEAKEALAEVVQYLKDPDRYEKLGARFPRGVIMDGPPGTGKTLLGRAVAGEANASFMACSGSDFQSMFVGMSSMKIRSFFARARRNAPCLIFVDEIDAIGGKRLSEGTAVAREMSSTLNQLLVQMDGFEANAGVIVVAATNRIELLDPALLRSGRFDRHIHVQLPTLQEREDILRIHGRKLHGVRFEFAALARACIGMSGADLENLLNQAALIAAHQGASQVSQEHALLARDRLLMGDPRHAHGQAMDERTRRILAAHEAGHAVVGMVCGPDPVTRVSIVPRGQSLGQTMMTPVAERVVHEKTVLLDHIRLLLGGRAAEELAMCTQTTGAADDLARASELALELVGRYGMRQGMLRVTDKSSDTLRFAAERQAEELLGSCLTEAKQVIEQHREVFDAMVAELILREEIGEAKMLEFMKMLSTVPACSALAHLVPDAHAMALAA